VLKMAQQLRDAVTTWEHVPERVGIITDMENQGDAITHLILREVYHDFVTPFDREDIALLARSLDDIADFIHSAADTMLLYKVGRPCDKDKQMVEITVQTVAEVETAVSLLSDRPDQKPILERCMEINRLENVADKVYRSSLADLFADSTDIAHIIKWREILEYLEGATDRCEDVADILEGIALKYGA
jgi:predicted phosphate transport protein (TIGR00153 family)